MLAGFRDFISRGNIVELAMAVVIGTAFGAVVTSLIADLITPTAKRCAFCTGALPPVEATQTA